MERTIQLWISLHSRSPYRAEVERDIRRAHQAWQGEDRIWLLPWMEGVARWSREVVISYKRSGRAKGHAQIAYPLRELAIQSEVFDLVHVGHIDAERRIFVPGLSLAMVAEGGRVPAKMYREWTNCKNPKVRPSSGFVDVRVPAFGPEGTVSFQNIRLEEAPGPIMPLGMVDADTRKVTLVWTPPESALPAPISSEAESVKHYGQLRFLHEKPNRVVTSENDPSQKALLIHYVWPQPFNQLFPLGGGHDLCVAREDIRRLVAEGTVESAVSLNAAPYLSDGTATIGKSWFWPRLCADGETNVLTDVFSKYGLDHTDIKQLFQNPRWHRIAGQELRVIRIWGWLGYFWFDFLEDLRNGLTVHRCDRCGNVIGGTARKRLCGKKENPECYRARRASAKRAERTRK